MRYLSDKFFSLFKLKEQDNEKHITPTYGFLKVIYASNTFNRLEAKFNDVMKDAANMRKKICVSMQRLSI